MGKLGKRQLIILGVMVIVILYAAVDFLTPRKKASVATMTQKPVALDVFVAGLTAGMAMDANKNLSTLIFSRAEKEWRLDPFLDAKSYRVWTKAQGPAKGAAPKIEFVYTGYLEANQEKIAIINATEYREGEELDIKGFILKSVSPAQVTIENQVTGAVQKITLQE